MGNSFVITVAADDEDEASGYIDAAVAEIQRIEKLLTTFSDGSETNLINRNAGVKPVTVGREVFELIKRSVKISDLTQGAFDITYGSADKRFWNFDLNMKQLPDKELLKQSVRLIDYHNVVLDDATCSVYLKNKGMRIGFGGIGKGYAAERAKRLLQSMGVKSGVINASGDLTTWGLRPDGSKWTIAIADPSNQALPFSYLDITDMSVATSGSYEKFVMIDGKRYSHTIDPKTGFPVSGIKSVTIICPNGEVADALATPVTVMGIEVGLNMINQMRGIACIIVDDHDVVYTSNNIKVL